MSAGGQQGHVQSRRRIDQCFAMLDILGWKLGNRSSDLIKDFGKEPVVEVQVHCLASVGSADSFQI